MSYPLSRSSRLPRHLFLIAIAGLLLASSPSFATTTTFPEFRVDCKGDGQKCGTFSEEFVVETTQGLSLSYTVLDDSTYGHCSSAKVEIYVDDELEASTPWMGWYEDGKPVHGPITTSFIQLGPVSSGKHKIKLHAVGRVLKGIESCNKGALIRWGGQIKVGTSTQPPTPPNLVWTTTPTSGAGPVPGLLQSADLGSSRLVSVLSEGNDRAGQGLEMIRQALPAEARWQDVSISGASLLTHGLPLGGDHLLVVRAPGNGKNGTDLTRAPGALPASLEWSFVNGDGSLQARHFLAVVPGRGTLVALDAEGSQRRGLGVAFVPAPIDPAQPLHWEAVSFSGAPGRFFQATVPGGVLVTSLTSGQGKTALALTFVPGSPLQSLSFSLQPSTNASFATYRATTPQGALYFTSFEGDGRSGADLAFSPGS